MASEDTRKEAERPAWMCTYCQHLVRAEESWSEDAEPACGKCGQQMVACAPIEASDWLIIVKRLAAADAKCDRLEDALHAAQSQLAETTAALGRAREEAERIDAVHLKRYRQLAALVGDPLYSVDLMIGNIEKALAALADVERVERWLKGMRGEDDWRCIDRTVHGLRARGRWGDGDHVAPTLAALGAALREAEQATTKGETTP